MAEAEKTPAKDGGDDAAETPAPPKPSFAKKLVRFGIAGIISAGLACVCGLVIFPKPKPPPEKPAEPKGEQNTLDSFGPAQTVTMAALTTNLADQGATIATKITIVLEYRVPEKSTIPLQLVEKKGEEGGELAGKLIPRIRDALVTHVSGKMSADLKSAKGKELLKLEILQILSSIVFPDPTTGAFTGVYFKEFLVQ